MADPAARALSSMSFWRSAYLTGGRGQKVGLEKNAATSAASELQQLPRGSGRNPSHPERASQPWNIKEATIHHHHRSCINRGSAHVPNSARFGARKSEARARASAHRGPHSDKLSPGLARRAPHPQRLPQPQGNEMVLFLQRKDRGRDRDEVRESTRVSHHRRGGPRRDARVTFTGRVLLQATRPPREPPSLQTHLLFHGSHHLHPRIRSLELGQLIGGHGELQFRQGAGARAEPAILGTQHFARCTPAHRSSCCLRVARPSRRPRLRGREPRFGRGEREIQNYPYASRSKQSHTPAARPMCRVQCTRCRGTDLGIVVEAKGILWQKLRNADWRGGRTELRGRGSQTTRHTG